MASPLKTPLGSFQPIPNAHSPQPVMSTMPVTEKPSLGLVDQVKNAYAQVDKFRANLNLPNPGTYEGVNREVKSEFCEQAFHSFNASIRQCGETKKKERLLNVKQSWAAKENFEL